MVTFFIHLKTKFSQSPSDSFRLQGPSKRTSSDRLYPVSSVKERNKKGFSDSRGMGVVNRPSRRLPSHPHPPKLKEVPKVLPKVAGVSVHFPSLRTSHSPSGLYNDCKRGEADGPVKGNQTSPIPGRLADQGPVSGRSTSEHSDSGRSDSILRVDNKSGEVRTKTNSGVLLRGLQIPSRFSPCKTHSREMAQTSGFDPTNQVKTCFDCKMFDVTNWVACLNGEDGPGGTPSHEALSVSSPGALEISSVVGHPPSLDRNHFSIPRMVAESHKCDERFRPSSQRPQYPTLYRPSNEGWGAHLEQTSAKGLWSDREKSYTKISRAEGGFSGPSKVQGPVSKPNSVSCHRQLNSGSLHKQTRRNSSAEMCALLWKIMTWCHHYQITLKARHIPGCLNVMANLLSRSNQVQSTEWSLHPQVFKQICLKWFTPHVDLFAIRLNHKVPLYVSPVLDQNAWDIDALNINWSGLTAYAFPPMAFLHRVIQKVRQSNCQIIVIAPGWRGMPWFPTSSVKNSAQTVPQLCVPQQSTTSQPPLLVSRSGQLQEQGFSVEVGERIAAPPRSSTRTIYKSKWALFEKWGRENSVDFSTPSMKQVSDFFMYLYQDLNRRPSTIDGYRTAIVDTLGPTGLHISQSSDLNRLLS